MNGRNAEERRYLALGQRLGLREPVDRDDVVALIKVLKHLRKLIGAQRDHYAWLRVLCELGGVS